MSKLNSPALIVVILLCATIVACEKPTDGYEGSELYASHCAACHGIYGDGYGPAAASIPQSIPDLRQIAVSNGGVYPRELVAHIIDGREIVDAHVSDTMPQWGQIFEIVEGNSEDANQRIEQKIEALVDYLESIQVAQ